MAPDQILEADWTWTRDGFQKGVRVAVDSGGRITSVGPDLPSPTRRLTNQALLPGFVNAHSHAFQRGLRGKGERFPGQAGSFWSWREQMYKLVAGLDAEAFFDLNLQAFSEMLDGGITTVGEFHYFHHDGSGKGFHYDQIVLEAARQAGIRIVLLNAYYGTGGIDQPLKGGQTRFRTESPAQYWGQFDRLAGSLSSHQSLGAVVHSVRAAPLGEIVEIRGEADRRALPFHIHVEEQRQEIEDCKQRYGLNPLALLLDRVGIGDRFTAIHCTHSSTADLKALSSAGGKVCICPLTEANLGDGIADVPAIDASQGRLCLGTDSNSRICFLEEIRWLEYVQRLRIERRGVLKDDAGWIARRLLDTATVGGAESLGVEAGEIRVGLAADFVSVDLGTPSLRGSGPATLLDAFVFGCGNQAIRSVCVGGRWRDVSGYDRQALGQSRDRPTKDA